MHFNMHSSKRKRNQISCNYICISKKIKSKIHIQTNFMHFNMYSSKRKKNQISCIDMHFFLKGTKIKKSHISCIETCIFRRIKINHHIKNQIIMHAFKNSDLHAFIHVFKNLNLHAFIHAFKNSNFQAFIHANKNSKFHSIFRKIKIPCKSSKCCAFISCMHSRIFIKTPIRSDSSSNYIYREWTQGHISFEEGAQGRMFIFKFSAFVEK